jgi:hypothetical protein
VCREDFEAEGFSSASFFVGGLATGVVEFAPTC